MVFGLIKDNACAAAAGIILCGQFLQKSCGMETFMDGINDFGRPTLSPMTSTLLIFPLRFSARLLLLI